MRYELAIKKNYKKNPIDLSLLFPNQKTDFSSLQMIDALTLSLTPQKLKEYLVKAHILEATDIDGEFVIIYKENGKIRELPAGPIFDDSEFLNVAQIIEEIAKLDKIEKNRFYNAFQSPRNSEKLKAFSHKVHQDPSSMNETDFSSLSYLEVRNIITYLKNRKLSLVEEKGESLIYKPEKAA